MWVVFKRDTDCLVNTPSDLDEDRGSEITYLTVAVEPEPPYQGKLALHAVLAELFIAGVPQRAML